MNTDDCETPLCHTETRPKARKEHTCCECRGIIMPGETYQVVSGVWSGGAGPARFKTCWDCMDLRRRYTFHHKFREAAPYGYLHECIKEDGLSADMLQDIRLPDYAYKDLP